MFWPIGWVQFILVRFKLFWTGRNDLDPTKMNWTWTKLFVPSCSINISEEIRDLTRWAAARWAAGAAGAAAQWAAGAAARWAADGLPILKVLPSNYNHAYVTMQRSLNKFIDFTIYVGRMVCLSQHYRLLFSCPTIAVWWCFLALICIFTLLYLILGFGISVSGTFFLFVVHPLYFHPLPTPPLHKTPCIFLAFQPIWHFFWCQMSWPGAHLKCKIQLLLEVLQTKKFLIAFIC